MVQSTSRKRSRPHDELELDLTGLQEDDEELQMDHHGHQRQHSALGDYQRQQQQQQHQSPQHHHHHLHHHRLPDQPPPAKMMRRDTGEMAMMGTGPPSVVGQAGMPLPAPRPRGPKLKFTPEDDQLLVDLKENKSLTWKQIAEFFPGRSSGTLQVRYCTKLKAKTTQWTDDTVRPFPRRYFFVL
ncbi:MAG: hypothetical protein M1839_006065 [Geoglossum umbratile]|nr:MAG: hypothetical protein M1839_006065 [Geoglossum umbratile]